MEEKKCSKCNRILPFDSFRWKNKSLNKKHSQCKECEKEAERLRYTQDKIRKESIIERTYQYKQNNIDYINLYKQQGCCKCGEKRPYVLDFHHTNPEEKDNTIAHMLKSASLENLQKEIKKCVLLCANCHREFHFLEKEQNITFNEYLEE